MSGPAFPWCSSFRCLLNLNLSRLSHSYNKTNKKKKLFFGETIYEVVLQSELLKPMMTRNATLLMKWLLFMTKQPSYHCRLTHIWWRRTNRFMPIVKQIFTKVNAANQPGIRTLSADFTLGGNTCIFTEIKVYVKSKSGEFETIFEFMRLP